MDIAYFFHWFALSRVIFRLESGSTSFDDWPLKIFFAFSLLTLLLIIIENQINIGPDMKSNEYDKGHNRKGNEHLTILIT